MKTDSEFDRNRKFKLFFYLRAVVLEVFAVSRLRNVLLVVLDHEILDGLQLPESLQLLRLRTRRPLLPRRARTQSRRAVIVPPPLSVQEMLALTLLKLRTVIILIELKGQKK